MKLSSTLLVLATLLPFLHGCTGGDDGGGPDRENTRSSGVASSNDAVINLDRSGTVRSGSSPLFERRRWPFGGVGSINTRPLFIGHSGDVVGVTFRPASRDIGEQRLWIGDLDSGGIRQRIPRLRQPHDTQITAVVADEDWVVWEETEGTSLELDEWSLFSFDRRSRQTRRLATAREVFGEPRAGGAAVAPGGSLPSLGNDGQVYFSAWSAEDPDEPGIFSVPADGSADPRQIGWGRGARVVGLELLFVRQTRDSGKAVPTVTSEVRLEIVSRDLRSGGERVIAQEGEGCSFWEYGFAAGLYAYIQRCPERQELHVLSVRGERVFVASALGYLEVTDDFLTVARTRQDGDYAQYVYLDVTDDMYGFGRGVVSGDTTVGGNTIAWRRFTDPRARYGVNELMMVNAD